jgi:hypothetical protein
MKTKVHKEKPAREKQIKTSSDKKPAKTEKIPSHMGYHGTDAERNLNPEE